MNIKSYVSKCYCKTVHFKTISLTLKWSEVAQSCLSLCDPMDCRLPGSPVPGILQARTLEWVAISFSNAWKWKVKVKSLSCIWLLPTPWTVAYQAPRPWDSPGKSTAVGCHCLLCFLNLTSYKKKKKIQMNSLANPILKVWKLEASYLHILC